MKKNILNCPKCNSYTLKTLCPKCKTKTLTPKPAKYSLEDRFGKYRRKYKENVQNKKDK